MVFKLIDVVGISHQLIFYGEIVMCEKLFMEEGCLACEELDVCEICTGCPFSEELEHLILKATGEI